MEGTPPPRGAEKGQRQACSWKRPSLYLPVRRLALPVGTGGGGPGGGSSHRQLEGRGGATQPGWWLPPRESPRAQGQPQSTTRLVWSLSMCPPTWGHLTRGFSERVPAKNKSFSDFQSHLNRTNHKWGVNLWQSCYVTWISIKFVTDNVSRSIS